MLACHRCDAQWVFFLYLRHETHTCCCTYPVQLHVLKLQAKVIALDEVAPQENLREEDLSKSFRLKDTTTTLKKEKLFSSPSKHKLSKWGYDLQTQGKEKLNQLKQRKTGEITINNFCLGKEVNTE